MMIGPIEGSFFSGGAFAERGQKQLASKDFDEIMNSFEREVAGNAVAREKTQIYSEAVASTLEKIEGAKPFTRFSCGEKACLGYTRSNTGERWFDQWYKGFATNQSVPVRMMTYEDVVLPDGSVEHRVLLTTEGEAVFRSN